MADLRDSTTTTPPPPPPETKPEPSETKPEPSETKPEAQPAAPEAKPTASETKPAVAEHKSWADVAEEEAVDDTNAATSSEPSLSVEDLIIDENNKKNPKFLDEPEDSNIQAVIPFFRLHPRVFLSNSLRSTL